jgi:hypothetical protein
MLPKGAAAPGQQAREAGQSGIPQSSAQLLSRRVSRIPLLRRAWTSRSRRKNTGIPAPYMFLPVTAAPDTAGMKHYTVRVPYDKDLQLNVVSETLSVADDKGNKFKKGGDSIPVKVPRGQGKKVVALTVAGAEGGN